MVGKDGIVLSTDSRMVDIAQGGMDRRHQDNAIKLHKLNNVGLAFLGDTAYGDHLIDIYKSKCLKSEYDMWNVVRSFSVFVRKDATLYMSVQQLGGSPSLVFLLAGYNPRNDPEMYKLDDTSDMLLYAPKKKPSPQCLGVGEQLAQSWFDRLEVGEMDVEMLKRLSVFLILEVAHISDYVNRIIQMYVINTSGIQSISKTEMRGLKREADQEHRRLTNNFQEYLRHK
jgi:20S proteasome alpha/beta subunit